MVINSPYTKSFPTDLNCLLIQSLSDLVTDFLTIATQCLTLDCQCARVIYIYILICQNLIHIDKNYFIPLVHLPILPYVQTTFTNQQVHRSSTSLWNFFQPFNNLKFDIQENQRLKRRIEEIDGEVSLLFQRWSLLFVDM